MRRTSIALTLFLALSACSSSAVPGDVPELPPIDDSILTEILSAEEPLVLNVWASWCVPCRSEAPLLTAAHEAFGDDVRFVGIDIEDTQEGARGFIAEYGLEFDNYFDRSGTVRAALGGPAGRRHALRSQEPWQCPRPGSGCRCPCCTGLPATAASHPS